MCLKSIYICARLDSNYCGVYVFLFCVFFFFFFFFTRNWRQMLLFMYCAWTVTEHFDFSALFSISVGPIYCSRDPKISLFSNFFIKNGFHGTIHLFKNYFATVFSVFSFQFQQNKLYSNRPLMYLCIHNLSYC